ncbi:hypothetical protein R1sor_025754 [Riccia sorocarpa]|uniref:DUF7869 domain-containing protein n=1 Tax=Riccia sorocarpa TaxID=122646 RepID=A0ABD3GD66_9MARC
MSGRSCYYSHNQLAIDEPSLYKSSIHDGMDSNKTAVSRLDNYVKALSGVGMLVLVKIVGILNQEHGPPSIAHVSIGRETSSSESGLLDKPFNKLPPTFYIQLDNSGKDNKNWVMMAFFSELVIRGVFKTVFISFLIAGHTHEDVDAFFSKVNKMLSFQHISNVPQLMAAVMEAEKKKALPRFITEVADYKAHALPYRKPIAGISKPVSFKFYM